MGEYRIKVGMWSSFLGDTSPEESIRKFAEKGWFMFELSLEHSEELLSRGNPSEVGRDFARFAADHGASFPQGHLLLEADVAADNLDETIDKLKRWLELQAAIGIRSAIIHPGAYELKAQNADPAEILERRATGFGRLVDHIEGTGITICIENEHVTKTFEEIAGIISAVGRPGLGMCLDVGHAHMAGVDQGAFIRNAGSHLKALHIHDNDGTADQHLMPYGRGGLEWGPIAAALKDIQYDHLFLYEIPGDGAGPAPVRLAKLDYMRSITPILLDGITPVYREEV